MPASCSSTYRRGIGTPEAMAISSTTLRRRRNAGSRVSAGTSLPPICTATTSPPPRSEVTRYSEARPITARVSSVLHTTISTLPVTASTSTPITATIAPTASPNSSNSRPELRRASAWCSKKFMPFPCVHAHAATAAGHSARPQSELDLRRLAHLFALFQRDVQQGGRGEIEHAGKQIGRERLAAVVVGHHRVV